MLYSYRRIIVPDTLLRYTVIMEKNEDGGYTVTVPSLPGCISEGSTWDEALAEIKEAISGYLEVAKKRIHNPVTGKYYEVRQRSSKYGKNGQITGLWSSSKKKN